MNIPLKTWMKYKDKLAAIDRRAEVEMISFVQSIGGYGDHVNECLDYAFALATKYGEAAGAAACELYEAVAAASGITLEAMPAATATYEEVAKSLNGIHKISNDPAKLSQGVSRLVKRTAADTTLQNAVRDGAYFAWVPSGDTCAFCLMLASNGWRKAGKKTLKGDHAEHIHANCDCQYAVTFDPLSGVEGYDPAEYEAIFDGIDGDWNKKVNVVRQRQYAANPEKSRAQHKAAYEKRRQLTFDSGSLSIDRKGKTISIRKTTDGKYGIFVSDEAVLKKQGLNNIEKAIDDSIEKLGIPENAVLPQIIVLSDEEMGATYAAYNYVDNKLFIRASMGNKHRTVLYQNRFGFADPDDPSSTARHELIHWIDAEDYRKKVSDITAENHREYLKYRNEQSKIELDKLGIDDSNIHTISRYASDQYILINEYDEAYTEYRVLNGR